MISGFHLLPKEKDPDKNWSGSAETESRKTSVKESGQKKRGIG